MEVRCFAVGALEEDRVTDVGRGLEDALDGGVGAADSRAAVGSVVTAGALEAAAVSTDTVVGPAARLGA